MDAQAKQQVAERVKQATNILVTVSTNPSVDQLAACIGLTLLLNKVNKHATAVFSGEVPSTLEFLQPEKTIETNTDSLRDFIISLDKAKADKLRYKVEDQFVRIFITPYKTSLTEKDLEFSQGDFNVEVVMALGVKDNKELDAAITAHGRILHDATVISVNAGEGPAPKLGQINWLEPSASSLSEMLASMSESFGSNLIDNQIATAFLTGIVAETERFSNPKTSPKVMTMSAQLMAAGANQQLIASKLQPPEPPEPAPPAAPPEPPKDQPPKSPEPPVPSASPKDEKPVAEKPMPTQQKMPTEKPPPKEEKPPEEAKPVDGTLDVSHQIDKLGITPEVTVSPNEISIDPEGNLKRLAEIASQKATEAEEAKKQVDAAQAAASSAPPPAESKDHQSSLPGSHTLLSPFNGSPLMETAFTANTQPEWTQATEAGGMDTLAPKTGEGMIGHAPDVAPLSAAGPAPAAPPPAPAAHVDNARSAVESALAAAPFDASGSPVQALNATRIADNLNAPPANEQNVPPAPPPVPPPLTPTQGVVIPSPYTPAAANSAPPNNTDSNTL